MAKLTLTIDNAIINKAKKYARNRDISLSKLVEFYFSLITSTAEEEPNNLPAITSKLYGMAKGAKISDYKTALTDALIEKYL